MSNVEPDDDESVEEFLAGADEEVDLPHAREVIARRKRADAAARASEGSKTPVDSGTRQHPFLRAHGAGATTTTTKEKKR